MPKGRDFTAHLVKEQLENIRLTVASLKSEIKDLDACSDITDYRSDYVRDLLRHVQYLEEQL